MPTTDDDAPETIAAQALGWVDDATQAITPPIHVSSTYLRDPDNQYRSGRVYARDNNPAFDQPEALITALEGGHETLLFASGMAAATAVFQALHPGDHVLAPKVMYWSLRNWLLNFATSWGLDVELIDMTDPAAVQSALRPGTTKLVWIETPANPLWTVTDIAATAELAHAAGALVAVDSTAATPVLTRPLEHGADLVMHSATKYLNGHSDLTAGALITRADNEHWQRVRTVRWQGGGTLGSLEAYLLLRGMRTLYLRVRAASASALRVAEHFARASTRVRGALPGAAVEPGARGVRCGRCGTGSAGCCRCGSLEGKRRRSAWHPAPGSGSARPRSAASRASSSTARASRAPARRCRRTCCGCRWASSTWMT